MATHSSILAWKIPWTEEPGRLPSIVLMDMTEALSMHARYNLFFFEVTKCLYHLLGSIRDQHT